MRIIHSTPHSTVSVIEPEPSKLLPVPLAPATELDMHHGLSNLVPFPHLPDYHHPWGRDDQHDADADSEEEWDVVVEPPHQLGVDSCGGLKEEYDPMFSAHLDPSLLLISRPSTPPFSPSLASNSSPTTYTAPSPSSSSSPSPPPTNTPSRCHRGFSAARRHRRLIPVPVDNMMTPMSKKRLALALRRPSPGSLRKHELFKPEVMSLFNPRNPRASPGAPEVGNGVGAGSMSHENAHIDMGTNANTMMMMAPPLMGNPWSLGLGLGGEGDEEGQRGSSVEMSSLRDVRATPSSPRPSFPPHSTAIVAVEPMNYEAWEQEIFNDLPAIMVAGGGEIGGGEVNCSPSWLD